MNAKAIVVLGLVALLAGCAPEPESGSERVGTPAASAGSDASDAQAKVGEFGLVLVESNETSGIDVLSNVSAVMAGTAKTGDSIVVMVTRNRHFDAKRRPQSGWIQVGEKRYGLGVVDSESMLLFGHAKAPERAVIDAQSITVAICVDDEKLDTDRQAMSFIETAFAPGGKPNGKGQ